MSDTKQNRNESGDAKKGGGRFGGLLNRGGKPSSGGASFNFVAPGQPDHWLENVVEFVGRFILMLLLTVYPLVLIYAAAVAFVPQRNSNVWFGPISWNDVFALIVTVAVNGAFYEIKKRNRGQAGGRAIDLKAILALKTALVMCGLIYSFFQNPWSANPAPFAMPALTAMLLNPIFLALGALIIVDIWRPQFLRERIMYDDENEPVNKETKS